MDKKITLRAMLIDTPKIRAGFIGCGSHAFRNIYPARSSAMSTSSPSATSTCQKRRHSPNNLAQGAPTPTTMRCSKRKPSTPCLSWSDTGSVPPIPLSPSPACRPG